MAPQSSLYSDFHAIVPPNRIHPRCRKLSVMNKKADVACCLLSYHSHGQLSALYTTVCANTPGPPGSQPFGPLNLAVRQPVLIPRPETEDWTIRLAESLSPSPTRPLNVLDLCTGTGCIPLLLCHLWWPGSAHATGVDISTDAIKLATENAVLCGIPTPSANGQAQNTFTPVLGDLMHLTFAQDVRLEPPYDLITSNPPYIPRAEYEQLPASVRDFEDVRALLGEAQTLSRNSPGAEMPDTDRTKGLAFYHRIAELASRQGLLRGSGGMLALEVGDGQASDVARIVENNLKALLDRIDVWKDPWGKERVVIART